MLLTFILCLGIVTPMTSLKVLDIFPELTLAFKELQDRRRQVAFTACGSYSFLGQSYKIPYTDIISKAGTIDTNTLKNGVFKCPCKGLYLVAVTLQSSNKGAGSIIYKNGNKVIYNRISWDILNDSGTTVAVLELNLNDTVSVQPALIAYGYEFIGLSCLTVIKLK